METISRRAFDDAIKAIISVTIGIVVGVTGEAIWPPLWGLVLPFLCFCAFYLFRALYRSFCA